MNDIFLTPRIRQLRHHPLHDPAAALEDLAQGNSARISGQTFGTMLDAK